MLTFMLLPNTEKFLQIVAHSRGDVLLHLADGSLCDLKHSHTARQLLRTLKPGEEGLCISLSNPDDIPAFLRYMQDAA